MRVVLARVVLFLALIAAPRFEAATFPTSDATYTNIIDKSGPWSIHVVALPKKSFELRSVHAEGTAIGLSPLSDQATLAAKGKLEVVAAINGDFYQRDGAHAGDPRGLQIIDGELVSAPSGSTSFWIDSTGEPHIAVTASKLIVTWPDGSTTPTGLNGSRDSESIELYTPTVGRSTRSGRGREITLEPEDAKLWPPVRPGQTYKCKVRSVRDGSNSEISPGTLVLSIGSVLARELPKVVAGDALTLSMATTPDLRGAKTAVSGGPVLVRDSKAQRPRRSENHMSSGRHPRSAIGWNNDFFFLVEVDGRQRRSVGMNLPELAEFLVDLGCTDAMNLDGGGSSTLWYKGKVRSNPCDGDEREIANSVVGVRRKG